MSVFLLLLIYLLPKAANAAATADIEKVRFADRSFHEVLLKCPDRVWTGLNYEKTELIYFTPGQRRAWIIDSAHPHAVLSSELPASSENVQDFEVLNFNGRSTVVINLAHYTHDGATMPFAVGVHELFHFVGQTGWAMNPRRGDLYPVTAAPRYERAMLLAAMEKYSKSGKSEDLGHASFWYAKWKREWPAEVALSTDLREGTARFVERIAVALGRWGCGASDQQLRDSAERWIEAQDPLAWTGLDGEGYKIGAVAAFLLERTSPGWQSKMTDDISPVDLLLSGVPAVREPDNEAMLASFTKRARSEQSEASKWVEPLESGLEDSNYERVVVPLSWIGKTVTLQGMVMPRRDPAETYSLFSPGNQFQPVIDSSAWMILTDQSPGLHASAEATPCSQAGVIFLMPKSSIRCSASRCEGGAENIQFDLTARQLTNDGLTYLCL